MQFLLWGSGILLLLVIGIGIWFRRLSAKSQTQTKTLEELRGDPKVREVEILGTMKLRATYKNGDVKIYQRDF